MGVLEYIIILKFWLVSGIILGMLEYIIIFLNPHHNFEVLVSVRDFEGESVDKQMHVI